MDGVSDFQFTPNDAFAYWAASLEHAYRVLKGSRSHQLRGTKPRDWDSEGLHAVSAAMGRARAMEVLMPELAFLWHIGGETPSEFKPAVRLLEKAAREDADREFRAEILLAALASGEVAAPADERTAA